jgi:hypothetical protein
MHTACGVIMGDPIRLFPEPKPDAGVVAEQDPCVVVRTNVSGNMETLAGGATAAELMELAAVDYSAKLAWANGASTRIHAKLSNIAVYSVSSTPNTRYEHWPQTEACLDHATIEAALDLSTEDGKLSEHLELVRLKALDDYEAHGTITIEKAAINGSYTGTARAGQCLQTLNVRLMIARDGTHGTLGDDVKQGVCDDTAARPVTELASAHWGTRWTNYGD